MDRASLAQRFSWGIETSWHLRARPAAHELSPLDTVKGLQALLLADGAAMLWQTLERVYARPVALQELAQIRVIFSQEGNDQRVWRAETRLTDGTGQSFGLLTARAPGVSSRRTWKDFRHLQELHGRHERYCVHPYVGGIMPIADGVAAFTMEWLEHHKELVFEVTRDGGVFLVNAPGAHRVFSLAASRHIWRSLVHLQWHYVGLRQVNIQAGDFVGRLHEDGQVELKLTTARELVSDPDPVAHLHTILRSVITASGYLSDGRQPFDRTMPESIFLHRMRGVLQRRFGARAPALARQQWRLFRQGVLARQEDWLKEDCVLATYEYLCSYHSPAQAWQHTRQRWLAYADAVQAGTLPPSWWFPAPEVPMLLDRLSPRLSPRTQKNEAQEENPRP